MRTLPIVFTSLFAAAPALAQEPPAEKPAGQTAPAAAAPAENTQPAEPKAAPAAPPSAAAVVAMEGAKPPEKAPAPPDASPSQRGADSDAGAWKFEYHGYVRAPMRVGMGSRGNGSPAALPGQSKTTLHYPVIPDDQYLGWQFTSHNKKDWAEMFFSVGNSWAKGTLALQGFNFTDAAWTDQTAQFGISQGYITLTPDLGFENVRLEAKAGSFWSRYGLAGKWDAGEYDTYLFGRTHVMGESVKVDYDLDDANTLWFEEGLGAKRPDPTQFNNARFTMLAHGHAGLKLGSDIEFTAHALYAWAQEEDRITRATNAGSGTPVTLQDPYNPPNYPSTLQGIPNGSMFVGGVDGRFELGAAGYFYAGYSHIGANNAISVAPAVEVLHAFGGGQFQLGVTDVYFGPSCQASNTPGDYAANQLTLGQYPNNTVRSAGYGKFAGATPGSLTPTQCSMGTGSVDSLLAQYEFSLTNFRQISSGGQKFWGEGSDLKVVLYGMANHVNSDVKYVAANIGKTVFDGIWKIKGGVDLQYAALPWLTFATRFDRVQPNSHIPEQSFAILSPRVVFKSKWVTREQISLQYSHYFYNQRTCASGFSPAYYVSGQQGLPSPGHLYDDRQLLCTQPPAAPASAEGFGSTYETQSAGMRGAPTTTPDENVFKIEASMWW